MDLRKVAEDTIEKQYLYSSVGDLDLKIADAYKELLGNLTEKFSEEVLNFNTCSSEALDYYWGQIFRISRRFKDANNQEMVLTDEQFREIIKIRAFGTTWDGSIQTMNLFLSNLFKDRGTVYLLDPQNMSYELFIFNFTLEPWEKYLFENYDIFPRPAGVAILLDEVGEDVYFGFATYDQLYAYPTTTGFATYDDQIDGYTKTYND